MEEIHFSVFSAISPADADMCKTAEARDGGQGHERGGDSTRGAGQEEGTPLFYEKSQMGRDDAS